MRYCPPIYVQCVSSHLWTVPRQIKFWAILIKSWDWARPLHPLVGTKSQVCPKFFLDGTPYLSIIELLKVGFKRLWEYGREGIIFESFSFAVGETAGFKVVRTNEVERCPQLLWNFQMGFHFWFQQKS